MNDMHKFLVLVNHDYKESVKSKSFWIITFIFPLLFIVFGAFIGYLSEDSSATQTVANPVAPDPDTMTDEKIAGMLFGSILTLFLMIYGAQIFTKVKNEKTSRIMEIMATAVPGRTMMLSKIVSVGLIGVTQILIWCLTVILAAIGIVSVFGMNIPDGILYSPYFWESLGWGILFFTGGYLFYGSLFAGIGALTDKNNENQEYMTLVTFLLLGAFYISQFAVDHPDSQLSTWCTYIPFTSASVSVVRTVSGEMPLWESLLSLLILYAFCFLTVSFAGKLYTAGILLRGKKLSPGDMISFMRMK